MPRQGGSVNQLRDCLVKHNCICAHNESTPLKFLISVPENTVPGTSISDCSSVLSDMLQSHLLLGFHVSAFLYRGFITAKCYTGP